MTQATPLEQTTETPEAPAPIFVKKLSAPFQIDDQIYMLAPLSTGDAQIAQSLFKDLEASDLATMLTNVGELVYMSLHHNYPDLTREQAGDLVNNWNAPELMTLILQGSGFICRPTREVISLEKYQAMQAAKS